VIWAALGVGAVAVLGSLSVLAIRLLQSWRDFKRSRRHLLRALDSLNEKASLAAEKAAAAGDTVELERSLGKLRLSLAQLAVLREALDEARGTFDPYAALIPRKS
jgi:hypothetical protein